MSNEIFQYYIPTRVVFGPGSLNQLKDAKLPGKKALIVITQGKSMRKYGILDRVIDLLGQNGVESVVFDKILPNPISDHVNEGAQMARENGCDFIIGLGGGSSIDSAKAIAFMAANPGEFWDYIARGTGKGVAPKAPALPIVAITTTAGTGTEADAFAVITNPKSNEKFGFGNDYTFPTYSIVDPELMLSVPAHLTAYQGFDALFHSTEGFICTLANDVSEAFELRSISLISRYLAKAVHEPNNMEARNKMAVANTLSGMSESLVGCASCHGMEHMLSGFHPELPHGAGLIMISEEYYRSFLGYADDRLIEMARAMGVDVDSMEESKRPMAFIDALVQLQKDCGVYHMKMSDYGIKPEEFPVMAQMVLDTHKPHFAKERRPFTKEDVIGIYERSYR